MSESKPPERFKDREDWTPAEIHAHKLTGKAPQTDEYRDYVRQVHEDAGLDPPEGDDAPPKDLEDMSPQEHLDRMGREAA